MNLVFENLVIRNLSFHYNGRPNYIVRDMSMEIPSNSITTLLGLNGSGKTTLLLLILGYLKPISGEVFLQQISGRLNIDQVNGLVGYLPQRENIPFDYSVIDFILLGCTSRIGLFSVPGKEELRKIHETIEFLGIEELSERRLSGISGGELQRVRIARLLLQNPMIILLDEPSSHLDIKSKKQINELIFTLKEMGKIIIYSTHDPLDALNFSNYSILMRKKYPLKMGKSASIINQESLSEYFDTKMRINEIDGQKIVLVENGYKTKLSA